MVRLVVAGFVLTVLTASASAGQKCIQQPPPVYWTGELDVHEDGEWHRGTERGHISREAVTRFEAFRASGASEKKVARCLEALIKSEKSKKTRRACKVPKAKRR
jgi:hypothetical protein